MEKTTEAIKHSGLGIASFTVSIVSGICTVILFGIAGVMEARTPGGIDPKTIDAIVIGFFLMAFAGLSLVALGLGIAGLFQKERKRVLAILGVVFSASTLIIAGVTVAVGLAQGRN